jgi:hypothetical protein
MSSKVYPHNNVMCAMMCVFVITFILGCVSGWIACHSYEMNQEKIEIKKNMRHHKNKGDYANGLERLKQDRVKTEKATRAEGSMHSQDPRAGNNKVVAIHAQSDDDPDSMVVARMAPPSLELAEGRKDAPLDRRHIDAISDDPDEQMMRSFESSHDDYK